ncbi:site-specific integrase [Hoeflea sp.]|uniref:site-specific integrase n=1 Tax=Hoeflea sp. TaxID=1940281 RepID=UPI00199E54FA|nr:site-specific integrase [Hoeflea sp.]MBC7280211.1 site-specific integrase [Hoeflea sp.]
MSVQYVFRRGAVYWWRRRLPVQLRTDCRSRIEVSLRTTSLNIARSIAAEVTRASEHLLHGMSPSMISPDDARRILTKVAITHSAKLDGVSAAELAFGDNAKNARTADIATGWAYRLFAAQGVDATVGQIEQKEMLAAGLEAQTITLVAQTIVTLRQQGAMPPKRKRIAGLMAEFNIPETRVNVQQAEQLYLRGMAAALLDADRRWTGLRHDDDLLLQSGLLEEARRPIAQSVPAGIPTALSSPAPVEPVSVPVPPAKGPQTPPPEISPAAPVTAEVAISDDADDIDSLTDIEDESYRSLIDIVTAAGEAKVTLKQWDSKTLKQHIQLAKLFVRFLGHDNPTRVGQKHLAQFRDILLKFPKNYGKSPRDHVISVSDILARAEKLPKAEVGLTKATINRHMNNMANIAGMCEAYGYSWESYNGISKLRAKTSGEPENERPSFTTGDLEALFSLPIWTGAATGTNDASPAGEIFHDARYWVPLIGAYQGARREEICGFRLDEIIDLEGIWGFKFIPSEGRRFKSKAAKRHIPIHPELMRLGFLDYADALRKAGHFLLFPELRAVAEATPMGDVFNDDWQKMKDLAMPLAKAEGKVFHSFRHWCNNEMKQKGVSSEIRKDILGHINKDVNEGTYSQVARLRLMRRCLQKLPRPSAGLEPAPVRLLPQVLAHTPRQTRKQATG